MSAARIGRIRVNRPQAGESLGLEHGWLVIRLLPQTWALYVRDTGEVAAVVWAHDDFRAADMARVYQQRLCYGSPPADPAVIAAIDATP